MKKGKLVFILLIGIHYYANAQTILTRACNSFRDGDSLVMSSTGSVTTGTTGRNVVWDFSEITTGSVHTLKYYQDGESISAYENGTMWRSVIHGDSLLLTGYENRYTLIELDSPLPILYYPFAYGDSIGGIFKGVGKWCDRKYFRVWGEGSTHADGEGMLILPSGDTLRNVLRVHSVRRIWQYSYDKILTWNDLLNKVRQEESQGVFQNITAMSPVVTETYAWYATG